MALQLFVTSCLAQRSNFAALYSESTNYRITLGILHVLFPPNYSFKPGKLLRNLQMLF